MVIYEIKKGQPIFFEDRLIAYFNLNRALKAPVVVGACSVEFTLRNETTAYGPGAGETSLAEGPSVYFNLDYVRGSTVIWSCNRDFTPEEFSLNQQLLTPNRGVSDISGDLTHSNMIKALAFIKAVQEKVPMPYLRDIPALNQRLEYGIEMHTHYAGNGKDNL